MRWRFAFRGSVSVSNHTLQEVRSCCPAPTRDSSPLSRGCPDRRPFTKPIRCRSDRRKQPSTSRWGLPRLRGNGPAATPSCRSISTEPPPTEQSDPTRSNAVSRRVNFPLRVQPPFLKQNVNAGRSRRRTLKTIWRCEETILKLSVSSLCGLEIAMREAPI